MGFKATDIINKRKTLWEKYQDIERDRQLREATAIEITSNKALFREIKNNPELLIEMCFTIVDKNKELVPFFFNEVQVDFLGRINKAKRRHRLIQKENLQYAIK